MSNLQDDIIAQAAAECAKAIDDQIMLELTVEAFGWTIVVVDPWIHTSTSAVESWCKENCTGQWRHAGNNWAIEVEKEATAFALKWC